MVLAAALWVAGIGAAAAQTDVDSSRGTVTEGRETDTLQERTGAEGTTQGGSQRLETSPPDRSDEFRDAAGQPAQRPDLRRPPADITPGAREATVPGEAGNVPADQTGRPAGGGAAGLTIGAIFLALIVFILYRRSRRVDTGPYDRP